MMIIMFEGCINKTSFNSFERKAPLLGIAEAAGVCHEYTIIQQIGAWEIRKEARNEDV